MHARAGKLASRSALIRAKAEALALAPEFLHSGELAHVLLVAGNAGGMLTLAEDLAEEDASSGYAVVLEEGVPEGPFREMGVPVQRASELPWPWGEIIGQMDRP